MKNKLTLAGLCFVIAISVKAQSYDFPSLTSTAMGLSGAVDTTAWAVYGNPSGISGQTRAAVGMGYHQAFMTEALSSRTAFCVLPFSLISVGGSYVQYGHDLFNIQQMSLTAARRISPKLQMGFRFRYILRTISGTDTDGVSVVDAGLRYGISEKLHVGVMALNPARRTISDEYNEQSLPALLALACEVRFSSAFVLTGGLRQDVTRAGQSYGLGLAVDILGSTTLRGAVSARPVLFSVGASVNPGAFELSVASRHHERLGMSPSFGVVYRFGNRN